MEVFVKYRILKMAVVIGLVASSSLAVAEGRFAYRTPMSGVAQQSNSFVKELENIAMCKGESKESQKIYNRSSPNETYIHRNENTRKYPGTTDPDVWTLYIDGKQIARGNSSSNITPKLSELGYGSLNTSRDLEETRNTSASLGRLQHTHYYFSLRKIIPTENYQWCVDNSYETAN